MCSIDNRITCVPESGFNLTDLCINAWANELGTCINLPLAQSPIQLQSGEE